MIGLLPGSFTLFAQESQNAWPVLKHYDKDHLSQIAVPLGGIGTGTVSIGGRGDLRDWEIMNWPGKGFYPIWKNGAPFFANTVHERGKELVTKALMGPVEDHEYLLLKDVSRQISDSPGSNQPLLMLPIHWRR